MRSSLPGKTNIDGETLSSRFHSSTSRAEVSDIEQDLDHQFPYTDSKNINGAQADLSGQNDGGPRANDLAVHLNRTSVDVTSAPMNASTSATSSSSTLTSNSTTSEDDADTVNVFVTSQHADLATPHLAADHTPSIDKQTPTELIPPHDNNHQEGDKADICEMPFPSASQFDESK